MASHPGNQNGSTDWKSALIGAGSGVVVVIIGLGAVLTIFVVAIAKLSEEANIVTAASSATGVIGTVVGAYFGIKVGSAGKEEAEASRDEEARKVQQLAAAAPADIAKPILEKFG